jgi:hypothetical protein
MTTPVNLPPEYMAMLQAQERMALNSAAFQTASQGITQRNQIHNVAHESMLAMIASMKGR